MSRGLLSVLAVLFLAASVWAGGPDDLFDARVPGALQAGQLEQILALENGRYTLKDGRLLDARPDDPAHPLLTNRRVAELLTGGGKIPALPPAVIGARAGAPPDTLITKNPPTVQPNFDGGSRRGGDVRGPPGSGKGGGGGKNTPDDPAVLQAKFLQRLKFTGGKKEREALTEAVASILKTKTGRELAEQFVKEGASAEVTMSLIGEGKAVDENGKKVLSGTAGTTDPASKPPKIIVTSAYFDTDPEFRRVAMAGTLAHELFGHAFEKQRADKAGFSSSALHHYRGDEIGSRLIDWMVQTELNGKVVDADPSGYLEDAEGYCRGLVSVAAYYAITLSPTEMKNPVTTLRARRKRIAEEEAANDKDLKDTESWPPVITHFVGPLHGMAKARFKTVEKSIQTFLDFEKDRMSTLAEIKETLDNHIEYWLSPDGKKDKATLIASADDPYLKRREEAAAARARALRKMRAELAKGRDPASVQVIELPGTVIEVSSGDQPTIDLAELGRMRARDKKKNPGHWKK